MWHKAQTTVIVFDESLASKQTARTKPTMTTATKKCGFSGPPKHFCHKHMFVPGAWRFMLIYAWLYAA